MINALVRRRSASRLACAPAIFVLAIPLAIALVAGERVSDRRMVIECAAFLALCLAHTAWPTLLSWALLVVWFALCAVETIEVALRPGNRFEILAISMVLVPLVFLLVLRPRADATERFTPALAVLAALVAVAPLFVVWSP